MTIVDKYAQKILIARNDSDELWVCIQRHFAGENAQRWRYLAMFALRETAGWNLDQIGLAMGHTRGHVSRCLRSIRDDLRQRFRLEPLSTRSWDLLTNPELDDEPTDDDPDWNTHPDQPDGSPRPV